jgi:hypothetical protein
LFPAYLESDEAYLDHVLNALDAELTDKQRQLRDEIRAHHPEALRRGGPPAEEGVQGEALAASA